MLSVRPTGVQLTTTNNIFQTQQRLNSTTERLATGLQINRGSDNPAGLIAAESLRGDLVEIGADRRRIGSERSQLRIQESGRQQAIDVLQGLRGLTIEAASDSTSPDGLQAIQTEIDSSLDGLRLIEASTGVSFSAELNSIASDGDASIQSGDPAATQALIDNEISRLTTASAEAGVYERYTLDVDQQLSQDLEVVATQALSEIADADFAEESAKLARDTILSKFAIRTFGILDQTRGEAILSLLA